jgi:hypothetical protein
MISITIHFLANSAVPFSCEAVRMSPKNGLTSKKQTKYRLLKDLHPLAPRWRVEFFLA